MDLIITTNVGRTYIPVTLSDEDAERFGDALYSANGEIRFTLADDAGAEIGVTGVLFDSERRA